MIPHTVFTECSDRTVAERAEENRKQAEKMLNPTARFAVKIADIDMLASLVSDDDKTQIVADYFRIIGVKDPE